jgi:transcriptional regulator with XRE-family HTH domain
MLPAAAMGARIRALRRARRLTLDGLAVASGVSRSMISEIERGGRAPTVLVLDGIATALGSSIARLTQDESRSEPVLIARADQPVLADPAGWERRILSPVLPGVEFEFMRTTLGSRVDAGTYLPHGPGSREYVAVERGTLELALDGVPSRLAQGDSIFYPGDCHHGFANPAEEPCVYYLAMDVAGDHRPAAPRPPGQSLPGSGPDGPRVAGPRSGRSDGPAE